jgi:hypothetical protein
MTNPYAFMGEPQDVNIVGFHEGDNQAMYTFTTNGVCSRMISAPCTDDLFHPGDEEAKNDRDKNISDLLFRAADEDKLPSAKRVRKAYGFDLPGADGLALLRLFRSLQQQGIHPRKLDYWRTSASMQENISKMTTVDPKLVWVLQRLDADLKGTDFSFSFSPWRKD